MLYHCFASFKPSPLFFKLVDSQLILMLLYDSLSLIISGVHQSHLGCWGHRSEKVKDKIIIHNVFGSYQHSVEMVEHLSNAIH